MTDTPQDTIVVYLAKYFTASFTLSVDGVAVNSLTSVGVSYAVQALNGFVGQMEAFTYTGDFGPGPHTVAITPTFFNGMLIPQNILYVYGFDFNGQHYAGDTAQGAYSHLAPNIAEIFGEHSTITFTGIAEGTPTGNAYITGSAGGDTLMGGSGNDTLKGGPGDDTLWGGLFGSGGRNLFIESNDSLIAASGNGNDTVHFQVGTGGDIMNLANDGFTSFSDVISHMTALVGGGTLLQHPDGNTTRFLSTGSELATDVTPANFVAANFTFDPNAVTPNDPDTLVLHVSENAWNGNAQFSVFVDGTRIGVTQTTTAAHTLGQTQDITLTGDFGTNPHTVDVQFLNDAWGGTASTDRNLYVEGITFNGANYAGETAQNTATNGQPDTDPNAAEMYVNGTVTFGNVIGAPVASTVVLHLSEDAWTGDAQFVVAIDGIQQGGIQTVTASHGAGQVQDITLTGNFGNLGPSTVDLTFLNDAWGGSASTDRNLYVESLDVNGVHFQGNTATDNAANGAEATDPTAAVMAINGLATFHIDHTAPPELMG